MADRRPFQEHYKIIPALGRNFEVGYLYNYFTDDIINGMILSYISINTFYFSFELSLNWYTYKNTAIVIPKWHN